MDPEGKNKLGCASVKLIVTDHTGGPQGQLSYTHRATRLHFFFFIRTKFIRTPTLRLLKKTKNNSRLQKLLVLKFDTCSY